MNCGGELPVSDGDKGVDVDEFESGECKELGVAEPQQIDWRLIACGMRMTALAKK